MSTLNAIVVEPRTALGTAATRKIRKDGLVPVNVYGHGQAAAFGTVGADTALAIAKSGTKVVDLQVGSGAGEKAIIREIQWNTFGTDILHVDFMRIDAQQRIVAEVPVHIRGTAPGVLAGGRLDQPLHTVTIECLAVLVPAEIPVRVGALQIGQSIHARELVEVPPGTTLITPGDAIVVQIVMPVVLPEETAAPAAAAATGS